MDAMTEKTMHVHGAPSVPEPDIQAHQSAEEAAKARHIAIDQAQRRVEELEVALSGLNATREQALAGWTRAEENLRAELDGVNAFLETAHRPLPSDGDDRPMPSRG